MRFERRLFEPKSVVAEWAPLVHRIIPAAPAEPAALPPPAPALLGAPPALAPARPTAPLAPGAPPEPAPALAAPAVFAPALPAVLGPPATALPPALEIAGPESVPQAAKMSSAAAGTRNASDERWFMGGAGLVSDRAGRR